MKTVGSYIFVDEVKDVPTTVEQACQWIFLLGVGIPADALASVDEKLNPLLQSLSRNGFHAKDCYKEKSPDIRLMNAITDTILSFHLPCFCFPFAKAWLKSPRLNVLQKMEFNGWQPNIGNYEFVSFYLFLHCLNTLLQGQKQLEPCSRLVCDQGVRKAREGFCFDDSQTLKVVEKVIFASRKQASPLALPDHLGYLFGKCRRELLRENGKINLEPNENNTMVQNECLTHLTKLANCHLFNTLDLCSWIDYEDRRLDAIQ